VRIVVLASTKERHEHFSNVIAKEFPLVSIVQEPKGTGRRNKSRVVALLGSRYKSALARNYALNRVFSRAYVRFLKEKAEVEREYFALSSLEFRQDYSHLIRARVDSGKDINDPEYVGIIRDLRPDVIVVMGTSLIGEDIIRIPRYGILLNLHTGLSPYYRGAYTNLWPILNKEPQYCGVTVHKLSLGIDSGDIVYNGLPNIEEGDTFPTINSKLIVLGAKLMKRALIDVSKGRLTAKRQWIRGKLYNTRDFNGFHAFRYFHLIGEGYLKDFSARLMKEEIPAAKGLKLLRDESLPQYIPEGYRC